jgi:hypothetical protein
MAGRHEGIVKLSQEFGDVHEWLRTQGQVELVTRIGTRFSATANVATSGQHRDESVVRLFQDGREFGRAYACCWGHYYNCNRTRIGMYCEALALAMTTLQRSGPSQKS